MARSALFLPLLLLAAWAGQDSNFPEPLPDPKAWKLTKIADDALRLDRPSNGPLTIRVVNKQADGILEFTAFGYSPNFHSTTQGGYKDFKIESVGGNWAFSGPWPDKVKVLSRWQITKGKFQEPTDAARR